MSDRLHEIIGEIGVLHSTLIDNEKINNADEVFEFIENYDVDVKKHYLNLLLQYYFQKNDLDNLKKLLLVGAKFDIRFEDIKEAIFNIKSEKENVIEFMEDSVIFIKDNTLDENLDLMYEHIISNPQLNEYINSTIELIKKNRYVCAFCYKNPETRYSKFFLNEDLLESLKRDLPYLLN